MNYNSGRIDLVKHKINDHSGDRHIQPHRQSNSRYSPVPREVFTKRPVERKDDERDDHHRQDRVRRKDREIDRTHQARSLKTGGAVVIVISEIRSQEQKRNHEGRDLTSPVSNYISCAYKPVSREQQQRARRVKTSVEMWKIRDVFRHEELLCASVSLW